MADKKITLDQFAKSLNKDFKEVSKAAKKILGLSPKDANDRYYKITTYQKNKMKKELCPEAPPKKPAATQPVKELKSIRKDKQFFPNHRFSNLEFNNMEYTIWLHQEVYEQMEKHREQMKRLGLVLQQLAAFGKTVKSKPCSNNVNRGWYRTPMAGGKFHYYLWWTRMGNRPVKTLPLDKKTIVVRAFRHHDDHAPLLAGEKNDYDEPKQKNILNEADIPQSWTQEQRKIISSDHPVTLINGAPGSGKTTALWRVLETHDNDHVFYLTFSGNLARYSEHRFKNFAPKSIKVTTKDFITFIGEICGKDIQRYGLRASRQLFSDAFSKFDPSLLGPWAKRKNAMYNEIRAYLLGRAIPDKEGSQDMPPFVRLTNQKYMEYRGNADDIGRNDAKKLLDVLPLISHEILSKCFPELSGAVKAIRKLRQDIVPEGLLTVQRIIIDEIQDLTLLEMAVVVELCCAIHRRTKNFPLLHLAGDDGQTVRPSGFDWGCVKRLLDERINKPEERHLTGNLRSPSKIADVLKRSSRMYKKLNKTDRPTKQYESKSNYINAQIGYTNIENEAEAISLLEKLEKLDDVLILTPRCDVPEWLPEEYHHIVKIPEEAKGLEYQSVCILDPGKLLEEISNKSLNKSNGKFEKLDTYYYRTLLDQLRVSISRATETLVFIDVAANESCRKLSLKLLDKPIVNTADELIKYLENNDIMPEQRVRIRVEEAQKLVDENPFMAWHRIKQAYYFLGDPKLPNGVADESLRDETKMTFMQVASQLLVEGPPKKVTREEVQQAVNDILVDINSESIQKVFDELYSWSAEPTKPPYELLNSILDLTENEDWITLALRGKIQSIRSAIEKGALNEATAFYYTGNNIRGWLEISMYGGDIDSKVLELRSTAFDTLLKTNDLISASLILNKIKPEDRYRKGQLFEAREQYEEAGDIFEDMGFPSDALRNLRAAGNWKRAVHLADGREATDLKWLNDFEKSVAQLNEVSNQQPFGIKERLTEEEMRNLQALIRKQISDSQKIKKSTKVK